MDQNQHKMGEEFRDIEGYEGLYRVSDKGNVLNIKKRRTLKLFSRKNHYLYVNLCKNNNPIAIEVHRLVAQAFLKKFDKKLQVDHINGVRNDNRAENLRMVTRSENLRGHQNSRGKSEYRGVFWSKNAKKWMARIYVNGKQKYLGYYKKEEHAALAYNNAAVKYGYLPEALNKIEDYENIQVERCLKKIKKSKYKGVVKKNKKWGSQIKVNQKNIWIGSFETEKEAAVAHNKKILELGLDRPLNIIEEE